MEYDLPHVLPLKTPFTYGAETVSAVTIERELTGGDLVAVTNEKREGDKLLRIVSTMTGWPDPKVKAMSARDFLAVAEVAQSFLPDGLVTGS